MPRKTFDVAVTDFGHAIGRLSRRLRTEAASHEVSLTEASVIARLARDGAATTADLARAEGVRPQSMGATLAALEEMAMVERKPHHTDGRQITIELTAKGVAMRKSISDAKRTWLAHAISRLDEHDRETLFTAAGIMERLVNGDQR